MPVRLEISVCDSPRSRRRLISTAVVLMPECYSMSHNLSIPHRNMHCRIVAAVKPHELICRLVVEHGLAPRVGLGALPLAKALGRPQLQPSLHKFMAGDVTEPQRSTAESLAAYFEIPVDAVYDERVATRIARERGIAEQTASTESLIPAKKPAKTPAGQAQPLSLSSITLSPRPIRWRDLGMDELKGVVEVLLEDDAMAPEFPAGLVVRFDPSLKDEVQFGNRVMVRDAVGGLHFREYAQAPGGGWQAIALGRAFLTLTPEEGAQVVAVKIGHFVSGR